MLVKIKISKIWFGRVIKFVKKIRYYQYWIELKDIPTIMYYYESIFGYTGTPTLKKMFNALEQVVNEVEKRVKFVKYTKEQAIERRKERDRIRYQNKKLGLKLKYKKYREENKDMIVKKQKVYREVNKEKIKQTKKEWYLKNGDKVKEIRKRWKERNKEKLKEMKKEWNRKAYLKKKAEKNKKDNV